MSEPVCEIGVYELGQSTQTLPQFKITLEEAWEWVSIEKIARWANNRRKNVVMIQQRMLGKVRDRSCSMGPRVIYLNAVGNQAAMALVDAWRGRRAA